MLLAPSLGLARSWMSNPKTAQIAIDVTMTEMSAARPSNLPESRMRLIVCSFCHFVKGILLNIKGLREEPFAHQLIRT